MNSRSIRCSNVQDLYIKTLETFIRPSSRFLFDALLLDTSFFAEDVENWLEVPSYKSSEKTVRSLKAANDCAELAIALATTLNSTLTKHDEQEQFLFQTFESHR